MRLIFDSEVRTADLSEVSPPSTACWGPFGFRALVFRNSGFTVVFGSFYKSSGPQGRRENHTEEKSGVGFLGPMGLGVLVLWPSVSVAQGLGSGWVWWLRVRVGGRPLSCFYFTTDSYTAFN